MNFNYLNNSPNFGNNGLQNNSMFNMNYNMNNGNDE